MSADLPGTTGGAPSAVPVCEPEDLTVTVRWDADANANAANAADGLRGQVIAENTGGRTCRLPGKPGVKPVGADGTPLSTRTINTMEMRHPGYVTLQPGQSAVASVGWRSWCGPPASDRAEVRWAGRIAIARVHGPLQPDCSSAVPGNLSTSWFEAAD